MGSLIDSLPTAGWHPNKPIPLLMSLKINNLLPIIFASIYHSCVMKFINSDFKCNSENVPIALGSIFHFVIGNSVKVYEIFSQCPTLKCCNMLHFIWLMK